MSIIWNETGNKLTSAEKEVISVISRMSSVEEFKSIKALVKAALEELIMHAVNGTPDDVKFSTTVAAVLGEARRETGTDKFRNVDQIVDSSLLDRYEQKVVDPLLGKTYRFVDPRMPQTTFSVTSERSQGDAIIAAVLGFYSRHEQCFRCDPHLKQDVAFEYELMLTDFCFSLDYKEGYVICRRVKVKIVNGKGTVTTESKSPMMVMQAERTLDRNQTMDQPSKDTNLDYDSEIDIADDYDDYER